MGADKRFSARVTQQGDHAPAILGALRAAEELAAECAIGKANAARLAVCIEELVSNVVRHGCDGGGLELHLEMYPRPEGIEIVLSDNGRPFDPSAARDFEGPDAATGGGVGLELVRRWALEMTYARDDAGNVLRLLLPRA